MSAVLPRGDEAFAEHFDRVLVSPTVLYRVIEVLDEGSRWIRVGFVNSFETQVVIEGVSSLRRCIGYRLGEAYWGRGIATGAVSLLLGEDPSRPLFAVVAATNAASRRVLAKCGFQAISRRQSQASGRYLACEEIVYRLD